MSDRFQSWTAGSTQAVCWRSASRRMPSSGAPSTSTSPAAGRCHPSSRPTSVDLPAPEGPTIATCAPGWMTIDASSRIVWPPARTVTSRKSMRSPSSGRGTARSAGLFGGLIRPALLERTERFEKPQREVALSRVLPRDLRDLLTEQWNVESPVGQQERASALVSKLRAGEEQPRGEPEPGDELHAAGGHDGSRESAAGVGPFDQQRLLFAGERALGAVCSHRNEPEERVEIEPGERPRVRPLPQVALPQPRLRHRGNRQRRRGSGHRNVSRIGIEQGDADSRQHELERRSGELRAEVGQLADLMCRVRALGHVGRRAALKIPIGESRNLPRNAARNRVSSRRPMPSAIVATGTSRSRSTPDRHRIAAIVARRWPVRDRCAPISRRLRKSSASTTTPAAARSKAAKRTAGASAPSVRIRARRCLAGCTGASRSAATSSGARSASLRCRSSAGRTPLTDTSTAPRTSRCSRPSIGGDGLTDQ